MAKIKIEKVSIKDIKEYAANPRNNGKAVGPVMESIKKFGYTNPILINKDGVILAGHTRFEAIRKTGAMEVEVIRLTHLSEEQERAFRVADNRAGEFSEWDRDLLEIGLREIKADDWEKFGFKAEMISKIKGPGTCICPRCNKEFIKI